MRKGCLTEASRRWGGGAGCWNRELGRRPRTCAAEAALLWPAALSMSAISCSKSDTGVCFEARPAAVVVVVAASSAVSRSVGACRFAWTSGIHLDASLLLAAYAALRSCRCCIAFGSRAPITCTRARCVRDQRSCLWTEGGVKRRHLWLGDQFLQLFAGRGAQLSGVEEVFEL